MTEIVKRRFHVVGVRNVTLDGVRYDYPRFLRPTGALPPRVFRLGAKLLF